MKPLRRSRSEVASGTALNGTFYFLRSRSPSVCSAKRRLRGGSSGEALRGGRAAGRLEPRIRSPPLLPRGAPFLWVWDSPSSRYCLVQDSGSSRRELHRKTRTFASARLNLIYDERVLSLCGADGFPPPTHPIARRLTRFFSEEAFGVAVLPPTPNHSHTYCSQAICAAAPSPAAERGLRAGSPAVRTPAGSPRCSRPGDSPAATSFCARLQTVSQGGVRASGQGLYRPGIQMLSRTVLGLVLQSKALLKHLGGLGDTKSSPFPKKIIK